MHTIEKIEIKKRTKELAFRTIKLFQSLPKTDEARIIGKQLLRSSTSVAANYRASCRGRSDAEFFSKSSIVMEEVDLKHYSGWNFCKAQALLQKNN